MRVSAFEEENFKFVSTFSLCNSQRKREVAFFKLKKYANQSTKKKFKKFLNFCVVVFLRIGFHKLKYLCVCYDLHKLRCTNFYNQII